MRSYILRLIFVISLFLLGVNFTSALGMVTIHSTTTGGDWNSPSTWVEGRVPSEREAVEILGDVSIDTDIRISQLTLLDGTLFIDGNKEVLIGNLSGNGEIQPLDGNGAGESVQIGSLYVGGYARASTEIMENNGGIKIGIENTYVYGDITARSPLEGKIIILGTQSVSSPKMLTEGISTQALGRSLSGKIQAERVRVENVYVLSDYYSPTDIVGNIEITENGTIMPGSASYKSYILNIHGDIDNKGTWRDFNNTGRLDVYAYGNIHNTSNFSPYSLYLKGESEREISGLESYRRDVQILGNVKISSDFYISSLRMNKGNLFVDGKKDIMIGRFSGKGEIQPLKGNGKGDTISFGNVSGGYIAHVAEKSTGESEGVITEAASSGELIIGLENTYILGSVSTNDRIIGKNITLGGTYTTPGPKALKETIDTLRTNGGYIRGNIKADLITIDGFYTLSDYYSPTILEGTVQVTEKGTFQPSTARYQRYYLEVHGDLINNGSFKYINSDGRMLLRSHGSIENNGFLDLKEIYLEGVEPRTITGTYTPQNYFYTMGDITLLGDFHIPSLSLKNNTLFVDGKRDINITGSLSGNGKIQSLSGDGKGESISIGSLSAGGVGRMDLSSDIETKAKSEFQGIIIELESTYIKHSIRGNVTGEEIFLQGEISEEAPRPKSVSEPLRIQFNYMSGNINANTLTIDGEYVTSDAYTPTNILSNLLITEKGKIHTGGDTRKFEVNIVGDVLNNGLIQSVSSQPTVKSPIDTLAYEANPGIHIDIDGNIENNAYFNPTQLYLSGYESRDYREFEITMTGEPLTTVRGRNFSLSNSKLTESNIYWSARGIDRDGTKGVPSATKCINVPGCVKIGTKGSFDYTNSEENNSNTNTCENIPSGESLFTQAELLANQNNNENIVSENITSGSDAGDPVNLSTGEFLYDNTLMQYTGVGLPFEFKVHYGNRAYYNGPLGNNFDFNYNQFLVEDAEGNLNYHNGKLGVFQFVKNETGFDENKIIKGKLLQVDGKYILQLDNKQTLSFGENKKVVKIEDRFGNAFRFEYNEKKQLTKVVDTLNREYNFSYFDHSRLQNITDFNGNTVEFIYYTAGSTEGSEFDLQTIKTINGTSEKEISFTYTQADNFVDSHNIVKLIDSENNVYVENSYDENDRVSSQKYGKGSIYYNYILDTEGKKIVENRVVNRLGNETIYTYDEKGNTIKKAVKTTTGENVYLYEYDENNNLSKELKPFGNGFTYIYDERKNLIEKRQKSDVNSDDSASDIVMKYEYDDRFNMLTQVTLPNDLVLNFILDKYGNIIKKETHLSDKILVETFEYNTLGELVKKIDANGNEMNFEYLNGNLVKSIKGIGNNAITNQLNYNEKGNIISITDGEGNIINMSYDDFNLLKSTTTPEGIKSEYSFNDLNKKTNERIIISSTESVNTGYEYDVLDNPTKIISDIDSSRQKTLVTKYDGDSRITEIKNGNIVSTFLYNTEGFIIDKKVTDGAHTIITKYVYDENNRLIKQINPNNSEVTFIYDLFDRVVKQIDSLGTTVKLTYDRVGNITKREVNSAANTLLQKEEYTYDLLSRSIELKAYLLEENKVVITKTKYDAVGNVIEKTSPQPSPQGEGVNRTTYNYDSFNRLIKTTDSLGNTVENTYNKNNKIISTKLTSVEGKIIITSYTYDKDSRVIKETNTLGESVQYIYNKLNQITSKTDKDGGVTDYSYDYRGNILSESHEGKVISYSYDINSKLEKVTDANNNVTLYNYDDLGRLLSITYPDGNKMTYEYDQIGNLIKKTDPNGTISNNSYDILNRLIKRDIILGNGVEGITQENYSYDALGRLLSATDNEGNDLEFQYDSLGRLITETNAQTDISYTYDEAGNRTSINDIGYSYDNNSRLKSIQKENETLVDYSYDSLSLLQKKYANGVETNYSYDSLQRLQSLGDFNYGYNTQGNIVGTGEEQYSYDSFDQITQANYGLRHGNKEYSETFQYDLMGNRSILEKIETKIEKNDKKKDKKDPKTDVSQENYSSNILNQYTSITDEKNKKKEQNREFTYDNNGNLTQDNEFQYIYDYKNRLLRVEKLKKEKKGHEEKGKKEKDSNKDEDKKKNKDNNDENEDSELKIVVEYKYDILGRRIEKLSKNEKILYTYAGQNAILEEIYKDNKLKETRENIYGNTVDDILSTTITKVKEEKEDKDNKKEKKQEKNNKEDHEEKSKTIFYQKNHLGSIIAITDEKGKTIEEYTYDVFGKPYIRDGKSDNYRDFKESKVGNTRLYTGREYDSEINLYYLRARYYSSVTGRFISRDPIDIADDVNLYSYVGNNGVMFVDRMGKEKALIFIGRDNDFYGIPSGTLRLAGAIQYDIYRQLGYKDSNINVVYGKTIEEFNNSVQQKNYKDIALVSHANVGFIDLDSSTENLGDVINNETTSKLTNLAGSDAILTIIGCLAGNGDNSIAEKIAKQMNIIVKAPETLLITSDEGYFIDGGDYKYDLIGLYNTMINEEAGTVQ